VSDEQLENFLVWLGKRAYVKVQHMPSGAVYYGNLLKPARTIVEDYRTAQHDER